MSAIFARSASSSQPDLKALIDDQPPLLRRQPEEGRSRETDRQPGQIGSLIGLAARPQPLRPKRTVSRSAAVNVPRRGQDRIDADPDQSGSGRSIPVQSARVSSGKIFGASTPCLISQSRTSPQTCADPTPRWLSVPSRVRRRSAGMELGQGMGDQTASSATMPERVTSHAQKSAVMMSMDLGDLASM